MQRRGREKPKRLQGPLLTDLLFAYFIFFFPLAPANSRNSRCPESRPSTRGSFSCWPASLFITPYFTTMASLLVANSQPAKGRRRLSFRRSTDQRPKPPAAGEVKTATTTKEAAELLLWTEIGLSTVFSVLSYGTASLLTTYTEEWQQHGSDHVQTGYRRASASVTDCLLSWTFVHNETVNIYSHILGALVFLSLPTYVFSVSLPPRYHIATPTDVLVCTTYLLGVAACFVLSATFHTLMSHSQTLYLFGMKLDFQGVLVLMWSATVPLVYYTFPCDGRLQAFYLGLLSALAGLCSAVTFLPRFSGPHLGPYRAALFGAFGAGSFALPIAHGLLKHGLAEMRGRAGLGWIAATVVCNGLGLVVYGLKVSTRCWFPGEVFYGSCAC